ncbi:MAG: glycosyltransferase family 39 protein [Candidatus Omnitrophica bacterium]|nr:glycosyltransferase family 39 protein [Candidatus Omnitrophota bacterium]
MNNVYIERTIIVFIVIIGFLLRIYRIGYHDFWYDEIISISITNRISYCWNPPLYFYILRAWMEMLGNNEFSLRLLSLVFSLGSLILVYKLGKYIFNYKIGLISAFIMAFSGYQIWYAQELRPYSMVSFVGLISSYFLFKFFREKKDRNWILFLAFSVCGIYSDVSYYYIAFFAVQFLICILLAGKRGIFRIILSLGGILLASLMQINNFIAKLKYLNRGFWITDVDLKSLLLFFKNINFGYNLPDLFSLPIAAISILLIWGGFVLAYKTKEKKQDYYFLFTICFLPVVLILVFSKLFFPVYFYRGFIVISSYYYMLLSLGLVYFFRPLYKLILPALYLFLTFLGLFSYYRDWNIPATGYYAGIYVKKPFRPAVKFLEKNVEDNDFIAYANSSSHIVMNYYFKDKVFKHNFIYYPGMKDDSYGREYSSIKCQQGETLSIYDSDFLDFSRLWLIGCRWERSGELDENSQKVKYYLDKMLLLQDAIEFDGLWIFKYVRH